MLNQEYNTDREIIKMLKDALMVEKMAICNYEIMLEAAKDYNEKMHITQIHRNERRHYFLLEEIYESYTGEVSPEIKSVASMPTGYIDMLKTSICDELDKVGFYESLIGKLTCLRQKEMIATILNDEKEHARILAAFYKRYGN